MLMAGISTKWLYSKCSYLIKQDNFNTVSKSSDGRKIKNHWIWEHSRFYYKIYASQIRIYRTFCTLSPRSKWLKDE